MLVLIYSAPQNFAECLAVRKTWGNPLLHDQLKFVILFCLGIPKNTTMQTRIENESLKFHDIIQEDFSDAYRNLTYKAVMNLKFITMF